MHGPHNPPRQGLDELGSPCSGGDSSRPSSRLRAAIAAGGSAGGGGFGSGGGSDLGSAGSPRGSAWEAGVPGGGAGGGGGGALSLVAMLEGGGGGGRGGRGPSPRGSPTAEHASPLQPRLHPLDATAPGIAGVGCLWVTD